MIATVIPMKKRETKSGKIIVDGKVRLLFEVDSTGDTQLKDLYQSDPLRVLFPNTDNNDIIQAALVNISGGLVGGDQISVDIQLGKKTKALIVGQSAEKVYRSLGSEAKVGIRFDRKILSPDGWPQNAVVFIKNIEHGKIWGMRVERKPENQALPGFILKTAVYPLLLL